MRGWAVGRPDTAAASIGGFTLNASETDVVLNLRKRMPPMAICATRRSAATSSDPDVQVLRWTFRRDDDAIVCELGLNNDHSAYELRVNPPWNPAESTVEQFDDAMSAFQRHAAIERVLVSEGWLLEGFESERVDRRR